MIIHNPILTGSFTVNGTDVSSITSSAASLTSLNAYTASQNNRNGTYATTGSNTFAGIQTVNSNLVVTGSITAQTLVVQTVTSSVVYSSGSNVFGNNIANTQVMTGSVLISGSIGIGTTPSVSPIEILSTSDYAFRANRTTTNSKSLIALYDSPTAITSSYLIAGVDPTGNIVGYAATGSFISVGTNGTGIKRDLILHNYDAQSVVIATNNTERVRVTGAGNVGINTTNPSTQLHIVGANNNIFTDGARFTRNSGTNQYGVINYQGGSLNFLAVDTINSLPEIDFLTSTNGTTTTTRMIINSSGKIIVAGTTAGTALDDSITINTANSTGYSGIICTTAGTQRGYYGGTSTGLETGVAGSGYYSLWTSGVERMRVTSTGRVGIGVTNPGDWVLNVQSVAANNSTSPHQIALFGNSTSGASRGYLYIGSSAGIDWLVGKDTGGSGDYRFNLSLYTGEQRMILYTNGNYSFAGSNVSDLRLKSNVNSISINALDKVSQLSPKSYYMNDHPDQIRYGFIAQEVKDILPDLISGTEGEKEYLGLDYNGVLAVAVKAIQELKAEIDELKNK